MQQRPLALIATRLSPRRARQSLFAHRSGVQNARWTLDDDRLDGQGRPDWARVDDTVLVFVNFRAASVDIAIITGDWTGTVTQNIGTTPGLLQLVETDHLISGHFTV